MENAENHANALTTILINNCLAFQNYILAYFKYYSAAETSRK